MLHASEQTIHNETFLRFPCENEECGQPPQGLNDTFPHNFTTHHDDLVCMFEAPTEDFMSSPLFQICVYFMYSAVFVLALVGNGLVCFVVQTSPRMKTVTNYFIVNLAVGDILMTLFCVPFSFVSMLVLRYWPFGAVMCKVVNYSQAVSVLVSAYTLLAISIDRYMAIMRPLKPRLGKATAKLVVAAVWGGALATAAPIPIVSDLQRPSLWHEACKIDICGELWANAQQSSQYTCALLALQFALPLGALVCTYARIAAAVWGGRPPGEAQSARDSRMQRSKRKMIKMMVTVVAVFTISWLPLNLFIVLWTAHESDAEWGAWPGMPYVWFASHWLAMSHSCYNPIIYRYMILNVVVVEVLWTAHESDAEWGAWPGMPYVWVASHWLAMSHSCYNPIIYRYMILNVVVVEVLWTAHESDAEWGAWPGMPYVWFASHWLAMSHSCYNPIIYRYMILNVVVVEVLWTAHESDAEWGAWPGMPYVWVASHWLAMSHSCYNPIIYRYMILNVVVVEVLWTAHESDAEWGAWPGMPYVWVASHWLAISHSCYNPIIYRYMILNVVVVEVLWTAHESDAEWGAWPGMPYVWFASHWLAMSHSCYNPIIYRYMILNVVVVEVLWTAHESDAEWGAWPGMPYVWFASHWLAMSHSCYNPIIYRYMILNVVVVEVLWTTHESDAEWGAWPGMPYVWFASHWLAMSHSCYNPIIYCYMNARYRRGFKQILGGFLCLKHTENRSCHRSSICEGVPMSEMVGLNGSTGRRGCRCQSTNSVKVVGISAKCRGALDHQLCAARPTPPPARALSVRSHFT